MQTTRRRSSRFSPKPAVPYELLLMLTCVAESFRLSPTSANPAYFAVSAKGIFTP